jgi:hypothetical protein
MTMGFGRSVRHNGTAPRLALAIRPRPIWVLERRVPHVQGRDLMVDDQLNVPLEDAELLAEVELTTNLIIAATEADASLSQDQVDRILGVRLPEDDPDSRAIPFQRPRD